VVDSLEGLQLGEPIKVLLPSAVHPVDVEHIVFEIARDHRLLEVLSLGYSCRHSQLASEQVFVRELETEIVLSYLGDDRIARLVDIDHKLPLLGLDHSNLRLPDCFVLRLAALHLFFFRVAQRLVLYFRGSRVQVETRFLRNGSGGLG